MTTRTVIEAVRDRTPLPAGALRSFANGLADGSVSDAQVGAFAMAALLNGLGPSGRVRLTEAMRDSGDVLSWDLPGPVLDKHSTGGIGDTVSLLLAPALAACGAYVPMISGRGLGHTGGTLDKLEALEGYRTNISEAQLRKVVAEAGCAIVGATGRIAPADRRLYAVRDVTATVESIDLITASILSKKLAAGLGGLVLDVKCGSGAFLPTQEAATALAEALVETANGAGCPTIALLTDMDQSLATAAGNALELAEVLRILRGEATSPRLRAATVSLGGALLSLGGLAPDSAAGSDAMDRVLREGRAAEVFDRMVAALGGPRDVVAQGLSGLPEAPILREVPAPRAGVLTACDARALGWAVVALGGGRQTETDRIDPAVGLSDLLPLGTKVVAGQPLARVHAAREEAADRAVAQVQAAFTLGDAHEAAPLILGEVRP
ncbi:thymidine phosphorylase [Dinoroseobacter sp. S76]|uniref:thymidine phosphorylase n=1 Tax=Dinoroseobacter sp. S76 TaxID=3415124 RepID=UPI003C7E594A